MQEEVEVWVRVAASMIRGLHARHTTNINVVAHCGAENVAVVGDTGAFKVTGARAVLESFSFNAAVSFFAASEGLQI